MGFVLVWCGGALARLWVVIKRDVFVGAHSVDYYTGEISYTAEEKQRTRGEEEKRREEEEQKKG